MTAAVQVECFKSTFAIIEAQLGENPLEEYIVCPNSTIKVGVPNADLSDFVDGDWPLVPLGPNVTFKCGADGKSTNNCVLDGSFMHFLSLPFLPQVGLKSPISADNLYVSGFTFTGDASPEVGGLLSISVALNAPGMNQVFNDVIWKDAKFHSFLYVEETALVPDEGLPDLSIEATLQNSEFRDVLYGAKLVGVAKQKLTIRDTRFANVGVFDNEANCNCTHRFITANTGVSDGFFTSTSDTYIDLVNNCFQDVTASRTLLASATNDSTKVIINNENNYVSGLTLVDDENLCTEGIGISTQVDGDWEECQTFADASTCPLDAASDMPDPENRSGGNTAVISSVLIAVASVGYNLFLTL